MTEEPRPYHGEKKPSSTKGVGETGHSRVKNMKLGLKANQTAKDDLDIRSTKKYTE